MNVENEIKSSVDELVRQVPPRPGFADDVLRQAHHRRRVTRATVAGTAVVALAGATAFAAADPLGVWPDSLPLDGAPAAADAASDVVPIDLGDLPTGPLPEVPWFGDGELHFGDSTTGFDVDFTNLNFVERVTGGYVVGTTPDAGDGGHDLALYLVPDDGEPTMLTRGWVTDVAVSADGDRVSWATGDWDAEFADEDVTTTLVVADAATGAVLHERPETLGPDTTTVGFLDANRVLVGAANNTPEGLYVWDADADTVTPWGDYRGIRALAPAGDVGAFFDDADTGGVVDITTGEALWTLGETDTIQRSGFSSDGQYAALVTPQDSSSWDSPIPAGELVDLDAGTSVVVDDQEITITQEMLDDAAEYVESQDGRRNLVIVEARTGEEILRLDVAYPQRLAWEPDGSLVFETWQGTSRMALVRCTVTGDCELATEPRETDEHPDAHRPPYLLGG